jgi:CDP-glycerol glycerophosphotransferase
MSQVHAHWRRQPVVPGTVLYESFGGNGILCNPEALFRALLRAPDLEHLKHTWVRSSLDASRGKETEFAGRHDVTFVRRGSAKYYRALATSQYLVNNATFPPEFSKRVGQTYLNTWHGTPLKRMGYDMPDGAAESANVMRNFVAADYLLSQNPFMTETMYGRAYKLDGIFRGTIIEEGYPRVDRQFLDHTGAIAARQALDDAGLDLRGRKVVVYAPTWRGTSFNEPEQNLDEILAARNELQRSLDEEKWCVVVKLHQAAHSQAAGRADWRAILVPNSIPTNVVLGVADVLVTDYSSIFFDFLVTGRPIIFFTPDRSDYGVVRGLYQTAQQLPGPVFTDIAEAGQALSDVTRGQASAVGVAEYSAAAAAFTPWDDGHAAERVIDIVFRGRTSGYRLHRFDLDTRPKILLHLGGMRPNGITSSGFDLVNSLDHERYDVSVTYPGGPVAQRQLAERPLHPAVRHFPRVGGMNGSKILHAKRRLADRLGLTSLDLTDAAESALWEDEWVRCFGDSQFDSVIDFSGYGPLWARLLLHSPPATRAIWLHNDMAADAERTVHGKLIHARSLKVVFSHYDDYDKLVSVSSSLAAINRARLAVWAPPEKFVSTPNCIDGARILALSEETGELIADLAPDEKIFVTTGRLSTEKNHARLIRAFARVHVRYPATRLVIIGAGPLADTLADLVHELDLVGAVTMTGQLNNPYAAMRQAHCFVLSSDYEGQPMVLLEAAVLGLPIVTVDFGSVADALPGGAALVVAQTTDTLADGMEQFLAGAVPAAGFDYRGYNLDAVESFYRVLRK